MCVEGEGRQATRGSRVRCKQSGEALQWPWFTEGRHGAPGAGRGRTQEEIVHSAGEGRAQGCLLTKRQCGLVTARGKHMATNGVVMGGEGTWEKLVQGKLAHKSRWRDIPLAAGQGPLSSFLKPTPGMAPLPGAELRLQEEELSWGSLTPQAPRKGPRGKGEPGQGPGSSSGQRFWWLRAVLVAGSLWSEPAQGTHPGGWHLSPSAGSPWPARANGWRSREGDPGATAASGRRTDNAGTPIHQPPELSGRPFSKPLDKSALKGNYVYLWPRGF